MAESLVEKAKRIRKEARHGSALSLANAHRPTVVQYERLCDLVVEIAERLEREQPR